MQTGAQEPLPAPPFVRLLAGMLDVPLMPAAQSLPDTLGQWIDWPRAVALSRALEGTAVEPAVAADQRAALLDACQRARTGLRAAILDESALAAGVEVDDPGAAFAPLRQWYQGLQRRLLATTGQLRGQLRDLLAQAGGAPARLAALDAVMEAVLSPREQRLLAAVPVRLEQRYLARWAQAPTPQPESGIDAWRQCRGELRQLLLAELDARFLPIDGLQAALRPH